MVKTMDELIEMFKGKYTEVRARKVEEELQLVDEQRELDEKHRKLREKIMVETFKELEKER